MPYRMNSLLLFSRRSRILEPSRPYSIHTLGSMSSAAAAADAPEEFGALVRSETDKWAKTIKAVNFSLN